MSGAGSLFGLYLTVPNLDPMIAQLERIGREMPNTERAVKDATETVAQIWRAYAIGTTVTYSGGTFVIHPGDGTYARSIETQVPYRGKLSGLVFSSEKIAELIEDGYGPFDMKPGLLRSSKARLTKKDKNGKQTRYITVPFRHNVPGADGIGVPMPQNIYNQASKLDFSMQTGRSPFNGYMTYVWGGRLPATMQGHRVKPQIPNTSMTGAYPWKTGPFSGMVRMFDTATNKSGGYLTFRRVSEKSDPNSWWHPGAPPKPVTQAVIENAEPSVLRMLRTGVALDLAMAGLPIPRGLE